MSAQSPPLVSILTPVYNGADHIAECIESVLAQTYNHWDYTIVNNSSTDDTLAIVQKYAARDPRIHVVNTDHFLGILQNHNFTAHQISRESKYCKFVFADDWLYPNCVEEMVRLAERNPTVGLVGAYTIDGRSVRWHGPPYPSECIPGREVCRDQLRGGPYIFGTMTSLLVRCDLIRKREKLFTEQHLQADLEACFDLLQESDFGFIHQVMSFGRERNGTDSHAANLNSHRLGEFIIFLKYGRALLDEKEYEAHWHRVRKRYHRVLAHNVLRGRSKEFWKYHTDILSAYGGRVDRWLLARSVVIDLASQMVQPTEAIRRGSLWWFPKEAKKEPKAVNRKHDPESAKAIHDTEPLRPA